jgi:hypothetical protein
MTYRELLNKCKEKPGWFRPMENSDKEFDIRYRKWATRLDEELRNDKKKIMLFYPLLKAVFLH